MKSCFILAADIGGTNSRFALFQLEEAPNGASRLRLLPQSKISLATASFKSFGELIGSLRQRPASGGFCLLGDYQPAAVSLAVPGPVLNLDQGGKPGECQFCRAPNIAWPISSAAAAEVLPAKTPLALLNDFAAQGLACLAPEILGLQTLLPGQPAPDSPTLIIGAGTGLGKAIILPHPDKTRRREKAPVGPAADFVQLPGPGRRADDAQMSARILPSEGGHSLFPFSGADEIQFQKFLLDKTGRQQAIGDLVVTGGGLAALFAWQAGLDSLPPPPAVTPRLAEQPRVLEFMARFYGRACRNLVLETLALGGVYLSGGLLSHVPALRGHPEFEREFRFSETQAAALEKVPVWWVSNQDSGLWGAALHGVDLLRQSSSTGI